MKKASQKQVGNIFGSASNMKYQDIKAACIMLGMDFEDVANADFFKLNSFYAANKFKSKPVEDRLHSYEDWVQNILIKRGHKQDSPLVKYREFSAKTDEEVGGESYEAKSKRSIAKKAGAKKEPPKKKDKNEFGIYSGTKKDYVYKKTKKYFEEGNPNDKALRRVIRKTIERFDDAKEKSIRIWFRKAWKELSTRDGKK